MKTRLTKIKASSHGGLVPIVKLLKDYKIPQLIRKTLPKRVNQAKYKYDDLLIPWIMNLYCGGEKIEQITKIKKHFDIFSDLKVPSHDTIGRGMKNLGKAFIDPSEDRTYTDKVQKQDIQENLQLNELLIVMAKQLGFLKENQLYTLHIDCTIIETMRGESKFTYKQNYGYSPCICAINDCPIFISFRNGNVHAAFQLARCLEQCLMLLEKHNIRVRYVISDSAGYNTEIMNITAKYDLKIITSPRKTFSNLQNIDDCHNWKPVEIETTNSFWDCEIGHTPFYMKDSDVPLRMIALRFLPLEKYKRARKKRHRNRDEKMDRLKAGNKLKHLKKDIKEMGKMYNGYTYKLYLTNDFYTDPIEIVKKYLKRGGFERTFSEVKQHYGFCYPPFFDLSSNSVFFTINAMAAVITKSALLLFNKKIPELYTSMSLLTFKLVFINTVCLFRSGYYEFNEHEKIPYHLLL